MGRETPGKRVEIIDDDGNILPAGLIGEIAIGENDPTMFLEYWNRPEATKSKFVSNAQGMWLRTGDEGKKDADGYFWFQSRTDDVITSSGYRIGPSEIEDCLSAHPAVDMAGVVGVPDPVRTELIKACVVLNKDAVVNDDLADDIIAHVKARLSPHAAPHLVEYIDALPMTATGKIMRRELRG